MLLYLRRYVPSLGTYIFRVKIQLLVTWKFGQDSDPHWFGSLDPDPHCNKCESTLPVSSDLLLPRPVISYIPVCPIGLNSLFLPPVTFYITCTIRLQVSFFYFLSLLYNETIVLHSLFLSIHTLLSVQWDAALSSLCTCKIGPPIVLLSSCPKIRNFPIFGCFKGSRKKCKLHLPAS